MRAVEFVAGGDGSILERTGREIIFSLRTGRSLLAEKVMQMKANTTIIAAVAAIGLTVLGFYMIGVNRMHELRLPEGEASIQDGPVPSFNASVGRIEITGGQISLPIGAPRETENKTDVTPKKDAVEASGIVIMPSTGKDN